MMISHEMAQAADKLESPVPSPSILSSSVAFDSAFSLSYNFLTPEQRIFRPIFFARTALYSCLIQT